MKTVIFQDLKKKLLFINFDFCYWKIYKIEKTWHISYSARIHIHRIQTSSKLWTYSLLPKPLNVPQDNCSVQGITPRTPCRWNEATLHNSGQSLRPLTILTPACSLLCRHVSTAVVCILVSVDFRCVQI